MKTGRSSNRLELEWARKMLVIAARAAGVDALDTVYPRVSDDEGLRREAEFVKQLGFDGCMVDVPVVKRAEYILVKAGLRKEEA